MGSTNKTGVAPVFILANMVFAMVLIWMPYAILVEFSMLLLCPSIFLFMFSFVRLRINRPEAERPFRIPGGTVFATLITIIPTLVSAFYMQIVVSNSMRQTDEGADEEE